MAESVPTLWRDVPDHLRKIATAVNGIIDGRQNNTGEVTLDAASVTTVVIERRCGADSVITLSPTTGNAASEVGNGTIYVSVGDGQFTLNHASNGQTDRTFRYEVTG